MNTIDALNNKLTAIVDEKYSIDLAYGKMGLCIYFYYLSRWEKKEEYKQAADKLLDEMIGTILSTVPILHSNRLYLLWGLLSIKPCLPNLNNEIETHIRLLKDKIDIDYITNVEFLFTLLYLIYSFRKFM